MRSSVLYYPHIEIGNIGWLKNALLLWDNVYRIVPQSYIPEDNNEVKQAIDNGFVRAISLEDQDIKGVINDFKDFVENLPFLPAGLDYNELEFIHPEKIDSHLYPYLEQYSLGESEKGWIELPKEIARGYMFFLANKVSMRRNLARSTDDEYSYAVSGYFSEDANFNEALYCEEAVGYYSSLIFEDLLPINIENIPMNKIIKAITYSKDEKANFRNELLKFTNELHLCKSRDHAEVIFNDFLKDLISAKNKLKASQGFLNKNDTGCLFTMGIPVSMTAYGTLLSGGANPFDINTIYTSLLIGAIAAYKDYTKTKSTADNPYGASYLISLEKKFAGTGRYPAFNYYFDEFIND